MARAIIVVVTLLASILAGAHAWTLDGIEGLVFGSFLREDTVYAPGYTDSGFRRVAVGMSRSQVEALIGAPQHEWPVGGDTDRSGVGARWSHSPGDTHFRCRVLLFRNDVVVEKHTEFYVD
jgi:hypothetical protein